MGYFEGLLGGFADRKYDIERENIRQADLAAERESGVYKALLNSPDPRIQAMAASGLIESAQPKKRKSGLRGWVGEMQVSPVYTKLMELVNTPVPQGEATPPELGHTEYPMIATPPPQLGDRPAGMAATSLTQPGAPPPRQIQGKPGTPPPMGPRKIFASPEDLAMQKARGDAAGEIEGLKVGMKAAGISDAESTALLKKRMEQRVTGSAGNTWREGEIVPDATSPTGYSQQMYLASDPTKTMKMPAMSPTAGSMRAVTPLETTAFNLYGHEYPGSSPKDIFGRLTPVQVGRARVEENRIKAQQVMDEAIARHRADVTKPLTPAERATFTNQLSDDFRLYNAPRQVMRGQLANMRTSMDAAVRLGPAYNAAAQEAVLVTFQKMLDPDSVVRETEARRPLSMQSFMGRIQGTISALTSGGVLTPQQLKPYLDLAEAIMSNSDQVLDIEDQKIEQRARDLQIDPWTITGRGERQTTPINTMPPTVTPPAAPGQAGTPPPIMAPGLIKTPDGRIMFSDYNGPGH